MKYKKNLHFIFCEGGGSENYDAGSLLENCIYSNNFSQNLQ